MDGRRCKAVWGARRGVEWKGKNGRLGRALPLPRGGRRRPAPRSSAQRAGRKEGWTSSPQRKGSLCLSGRAAGTAQGSPASPTSCPFRDAGAFKGGGAANPVGGNGPWSLRYGALRMQRLGDIEKAPATAQVASVMYSEKVAASRWTPRMALHLHRHHVLIAPSNCTSTIVHVSVEHSATPTLILFR